MGTQTTVELNDLYLGGIKTRTRFVEGSCFDETGELVDTVVPQIVAQFDCGWIPSYCDDALVFDCRSINQEFIQELIEKDIPYVIG